MKKLLCLLLCLCLMLPLAACAADTPAVTTTAPTTGASLKDRPLQLGVLYPGKIAEENTATYALHQELKKAMRRRGLDEELGICVQELVPERSEDVLAAVDRLVEAGAVLIFGTALGYSEGMNRAADKYPDVIFCQLGGTVGNESNLATYFAPLYYAYFMAGAAVAMKALELETQEIGFISTSGKDHPEAAAIINAFTRGVQVYLPSATVRLRVLEPGATEAMEMNAVDDLFQLYECRVFGTYTHTAGALRQASSLGLYATGPWFTDNGLESYQSALLVAPQVRWFSFFVDAIKAAEQCNVADEFSTALGTSGYYGEFGCDNFMKPDKSADVWLAEFGGGCSALTAIAMSALRPDNLYDWDVLPPTEQYPTGTVVTFPSEIFKGPFAGVLYAVNIIDEHTYSISASPALMADTEGNVRIEAGGAALEPNEIREMDYYIMGIEVV